MLVTSIIVGGISRTADTFLAHTEITKDAGDRMGSAKLRIRVYPHLMAVTDVAVADVATVGYAIVAGQEVEILGTSDSSLFGGPEFGSPLFGEDLPEGNAIFRGTVVHVSPKMLVNRDPSVQGGGEGEFGEPLFGEPVFGGEQTIIYNRANVYDIECRDWNSLLDETIDTEQEFENETDDAILGTLFAAVPEVDTSLVSSTAFLSTFTVGEESIRSAATKVADRTGAEFFIDPDKRFRYFLPITNPAPFGLSESPDNATTFGFERGTLQWDVEWRTPANRVVVLGELQSGGSSLRAICDNVHSQASYGIKSRTIIDRSIKSTQEAKARGDVELARSAYPDVSGSLVTRQDGLDIGQYLTVECPETLQLSGQFVVRRMTMKWETRTRTRYEIQFGGYRPDVARTVMKLAEVAKGSTLPQKGIPPPQTITVENFASTIEPVRIVNSLPTLPDAAYSDNAVVLLTTDRKIYRRSGTSWVAVVPTTDLTGQITTTQIGDDQITTAKILALNITSGKLAANSVIAGKIGADAVVAGTIAAGAIRAVDAVFEAAAIQAADIGHINATTIDAGTLNCALIGVANLNADSINAGTLSVTHLSAGTAQLGGGQANFQGDGSVTSGTFRVTHTSSGNVCSMLATSTQSRLTAFDGGSDFARISTDDGSGQSFFNAVYGSESCALVAQSGNTRLEIGGLKVVGNRNTGWTAPTGTATKTGFNTASPPSNQVLAEHLKAVIDALIAHGMIGA